MEWGTLVQSRGPRHQSDIHEHRDTYGQAQVCIKGHQGSSVDRPRQPSIREQVLACTASATSEYSTTSQCFSALLSQLGRVKFILDGLRWKKINKRTYQSHTTTGRRLSTIPRSALPVARISFPFKKNPKPPWERDPRQSGQGSRSLHGKPHTRLEF